MIRRSYSLASNGFKGRSLNGERHPCLHITTTHPCYINYNQIALKKIMFITSILQLDIALSKDFIRS